MFKRFVAAWHVLMGQRLTPLQIQSEWVEYQQIFRDLLEQFSASLARQSKAEKKRLDRLGEVVEQIPAPPVDERAARKAALRARMVEGGRHTPQREVS